LSGRIYTECDVIRGNTLVLELPLVQPVRSDLEDERWRAPVPETTPTPTLRVYVLDQQGVRRAGFSRFLDAQQALRVVGQAAAIEEARRSIGWLQPDVVFVDAEGAAAAATVREVREVSPNSVVIGLASRTGHVHPDELRAAGAVGILPQHLERVELLRAITQLVGGQEFALGFAQVDTAVAMSSALNTREWAILKLIVNGCTNAEIGAELFLAPKTIERYVATIIHKVGARNRAHLVGVAIGRGLANPPTE
jgi:DNA-binding NarL/FixJ family response regulator